MLLDMTPKISLALLRLWSVFFYTLLLLHSHGTGFTPVGSDGQHRPLFAICQMPRKQRDARAGVYTVLIMLLC